MPDDHLHTQKTPCDCSNKEEKDMATAWPYYHESQAKYDRLCAIKKAVDPRKVFTPSKFSVQFDALTKTAS
jgi:hypothetical protein